MLLGDVDELEVDRERADDGRLLLERQLSHRVAELPARSSLACLTREQPNPLLCGQQLLALLLDEHAAEHVAEKPNVPPEPRVRAHAAHPDSGEGYPEGSRAGSPLIAGAGRAGPCARPRWPCASVP